MSEYMYICMYICMGVCVHPSVPAPHFSPLTHPPHQPPNQANTKKQKYERILERKMATSPEQLCKGFPSEFRSYFEYCRALRCVVVFWSFCWGVVLVRWIR